MIVRVMGEGQWRVDDALFARLQELDAATESAVAAGDQAALHAALEALAAAVRAGGEKLDSGHLAPSDAVIPPADLSLEEARALLGDDELIPDLV